MLGVTTTELADATHKKREGAFKLVAKEFANQNDNGTQLWMRTLFWMQRLLASMRILHGLKTLSKINCTKHRASVLPPRVRQKQVRQTPRLANKNQGSQDAVARIVGHSYTREGVVKYTTEFMEAFAYDTSGKGKKKKMPNRKLTYTELIGMRHGKRLVGQL